jgi:hypothetical protein
MYPCIGRKGIIQPMEKAPENDKSLEREKYASDLYSAVDFLFDRRKIPSISDDFFNRYSELPLDGNEIEFIQPVFTDRFMEPPKSVEIFLMGRNPNIYPVTDWGGVQVTMRHSDDEFGPCTSLYTIWFEGQGAENISIYKYVRTVRNVIFDNVPMDEYEQAALRAMIGKL